MGLQSVRHTLNGLAELTWNRIVEGDAHGLRLREDTLTEMNLLDLVMRCPDLRMRRFNQSEEASVGADWEWWMGDARSGWFSLRIQAKRCDGSSYRQLDHPGERDDEFQYDTLIRAAEADHAFPYYVFFNGWASGWPTDAAWGCSRCSPPDICSHLSIKHFGCAAVPARVVRELHRDLGRQRRRVAPHLSASVPWSHLFDPWSLAHLGVGPWSPSPVPATVLLALHYWFVNHDEDERDSARLQLEMELVRPRRTYSWRRGLIGDLLGGVLRPTLPRYAEVAHGRQAVDTGETFSDVPAAYVVVADLERLTQS